ncbi:MAG: alpha/beta hydrolase [Armatimonadetes bacterium]|nr:alpha/beta hydrolase [Armatimonadota bacterium]MDI9586250.1 alpha/beta hydrolase [Acidobacteriota bacterium]
MRAVEDTDETRPRILMIHGFGCDSRFWEPQAKALADDGWEVSVPDLPYHGTPGEGVELSLEGLARWVIDTQLDRPALLIGHSLGGMMSLEIVQHVPDKVVGIALVDSFTSLQLNSLHLPGMFVEGLHTDKRKWIEDTRRGIIERMPQARYDAIWPSVAAFDSRPWLPAITCPVLGLYAGRGKYGPDDCALLQVALALDMIAGPVRVEVVADAGHFLNLERPDEVNRILLCWLNENFTAR